MNHFKIRKETDSSLKRTLSSFKLNSFSFRGKKTEFKNAGEK